MNNYQRIQEIYASLPTIACKKLCAHCCVGIRLTPEENRRIKRATGTQGFPMNIEERIKRKEDPTCGFLDRGNGLCTIHPMRPMICRVWGLTPSMPCPHGCIPSRVLPDKEAHIMMTEVCYLGGEIDYKDYQKQLGYAGDDEIWPLILQAKQGKMEWSELTRRVWEIENGRGTL